MKDSYIFEQIKELVPLDEAVEQYTGESLQRNKMRCPFHLERTASFTLYPENNSFYCFGCGLGGSVIDFVMLYFKINTSEALKKLDTDFSLGLIGNQCFGEQVRAYCEGKRRRAERQKREQQRQEAERQYWAAFDKVLEYECLIEQHRPPSPTAKPPPEFIKALQNKEYAAHCLECAEIERRKKFEQK